MQVTANELNAMKTIAVGLADLAKLGQFDGKDEMLGHFKKAKKVWWATVRSRYGLSSGKGTRRLSVELDGDRAGELRYKAKTVDEKANIAGRVLPQAQAQGSNGASAPTHEQQTALIAAAAALKQAGDAIAAMSSNGAANDRVGYAAAQSLLG